MYNAVKPYIYIYIYTHTHTHTHTPQDSTKPLQLLGTVWRPTSHLPFTTVWWLNTLVFQSISPGLVKTDFLISSGSKILTPETAYAGKPHLMPEDVVEAVLFALGCPPHVQVSPRLRCSTQLVRLTAAVFNYHHQCVSVSPNSQRGMSTLSVSL